MKAKDLIFFVAIATALIIGIISFFIKVEQFSECREKHGITYCVLAVWR